MNIYNKYKLYRAIYNLGGYPMLTHVNRGNQYTLNMAGVTISVSEPFTVSSDGNYLLKVESDGIHKNIPVAYTDNGILASRVYNLMMIQHYNQHLGKRK